MKNYSIIYDNGNVLYKTAANVIFDNGNYYFENDIFGRPLSFYSGEHIIEVTEEEEVIIYEK